MAASRSLEMAVSMISCAFFLGVDMLRECWYSKSVFESRVVYIGVAEVGVWAKAKTK
jgi:hypothetical protein